MILIWQSLWQYCKVCIITQLEDKSKAQRPTKVNVSSYAKFSKASPTLPPPMNTVFEFPSSLTNLSSSSESLQEWPLRREQSIKVCLTPGSLFQRFALSFSPLKVFFLPKETRWGGLRSRDSYLWKASERLSNPPPANRRQDVSTKETAGHLAASCLPRPQPSFFLSFHSLFLVRKQRKTMLWGDWLLRGQNRRGGLGCLS